MIDENFNLILYLRKCEIMELKLEKDYQSDDYDDLYSYISQNKNNKISEFVFLENAIVPLFVIEIKEHVTYIYYCCTLQELVTYFHKYLLTDYCPQCNKIVLKEVKKISIKF